MYTSENVFKMKSGLKALVSLVIILLFSLNAISQRGGGIKWSDDGNSYYRMVKDEIVQYTLPSNEAKTLISKQQLTPQGSTTPLKLSFFTFSADKNKALLFTNTQKVWRLRTKGDYWVLDLNTNSLTQLGKSLPASSLMFAKFSPDGKSVGYVSGNNIYVEDLATSQIKPMTTDGTVTLINGTFDWVYEEEFACRDGFRWSPDSKSIAYWQIDASSIKKFYMINNTDSIYAQLVPI
jgi:dipeptidyl-peptidase 4